VSRPERLNMYDLHNFAYGEKMYKTANGNRKSLLGSWLYISETNKNLATAIRSWPAFCSTLASYHVFSTQRTITLNNMLQRSQSVDNSRGLTPERKDLNAAVPTSIQCMVFRSNSGPVLFSFRDMTAPL